MSSRLPLGWSKLLEGLPKAEVALEEVSNTKGLQVETGTTIHRTLPHRKTILLRIDSATSGHLQPKVFPQLASAPSVELS
jgi:hypothetical protein